MNLHLPKRILLLTTLLLVLAAGLYAQNFVNKIQVPYLIEEDTILLRVDVKQHNFNPNGTDSLNTLVQTYAFNHMDSSSLTILGPSILWRYGHQVHTEVFNNLPWTTTSHWHGAHVPPFADGGPHQRIYADSTWKIDFEVLDKSATMWYHPHVMDATYEQVQMGMSGMLYVEDPPNDPNGLDDPQTNFMHQILPVDYGVNDHPIIVQTKKFYRDTTGVIRVDSGGIGSGIRGYKDDYYYLVNGLTAPYIELPAVMNRLRILNGDSKFTFNLGIGDKSLNPLTFQLIATDAGYTDRTYPLNSLVIGPGKRAECLIDLRGYAPGDSLFLINYADRFYDVYQGFPPKSIIGDSATTNGYAGDTTIMKIVIGPSAGPPSPIIGFPVNQVPNDVPAFDSQTRMRDKLFSKGFDSTQNANVFLINNTPMNMMVINDTINLGDTELWKIRNHTPHAHPFHIHDIHFWVVEVVDTANNDTLKPEDYPWLFKGPLDNVLVMPGWHLTFVGVFDDFGVPYSDSMFAETYMFHCHILPHEDRGMMGQFAVWNGLSTQIAEQLPEDVKLTIYPNPANDKIYLKGKSSERSEIKIYDLQGRILRTYDMDPFDGVGRISVADLPRGYVIMEWQSSRGRVVNKVMIK